MIKLHHDQNHTIVQSILQTQLWVFPLTRHRKKHKLEKTPKTKLQYEQSIFHKHNKNKIIIYKVEHTYNNITVTNRIRDKYDTDVTDDNDDDSCNHCWRC